MSSHCFLSVSLTVGLVYTLDGNMSGDQITFTPTHCSPPRDPGAAGLSEMETLRMFVNQRLTAAVEDILAVFGRTVSRYREQIDRQQQQLDGLMSEEGAWIRAADPQCAPSWIKVCPELEQMVQADSAEVLGPGTSGPKTSGPLIKYEADHGGSGDGAAASDSDTDDSEDHSRPEDTTGQRSPQQQEEASLLPLFSCKVCGEAFERRGYVDTHTVAHPRDCGVCGKHLERPENLKPHLRAHRDTSFRCNVCRQTFTQRGNLRTHMRIHTGEKPFSCSYCDRSFVEKGNLTVHLWTHTGERPYWGSVCGRRFSQLSCFQKHPCHRRGLSPT